MDKTGKVGEQSADTDFLLNGDGVNVVSSVKTVSVNSCKQIDVNTL